MGLLGNGFRYNLAGRITTATSMIDGANPSCLPASYNLTAFKRNQLAGEASFNAQASIPAGTRHPVAWLMPRKPGGLASHNETRFSVTTTGTGVYGRNLSANITLDMAVDQAALALVVGGVASISMGFTVDNPVIVGALLAQASFTGPSFTMTPVLGAQSGLGATLTMTFTPTATATANGFISATISGQGAEVTPQSVANEVWNSVAAVFNVAGTMGNKVNSAASAGDPWTTILPGSYLAGTAGQIIGTLQNDINLHTDAALIDIDEEVDRLSFYGAVHVDSVNGASGTTWPLGTPAHPVNNLPDARAIALANGFNTYALTGSFSADDGFDNVILRGETGFTADTFDLNLKVFNSCRIENMTVTGVMSPSSNAANVFSDCYLKNVYNIQGEVANGRMEADIFIAPGKTLSVAGAIVEGDFTVLDMGSHASTVFSADLASGSVLIKNAVAGSLAEMNISGGDITLDASCTGGEYWIEGYGAFYNESTMTEKGNQLITTVLLAEMNAAPVAVNAVQMNSIEIIGIGQSTDKWRGVGEPS